MYVQLANNIIQFVKFNTSLLILSPNILAIESGLVPVYKNKKNPRRKPFYHRFQDFIYTSLTLHE